MNHAESFNRQLNTLIKFDQRRRPGRPYCASPGRRLVSPCHSFQCTAGRRSILQHKKPPCQGGFFSPVVLLSPPPARWPGARRVQRRRAPGAGPAPRSSYFRRRRRAARAPGRSSGAAHQVPGGRRGQVTFAATGALPGRPAGAPLAPGTRCRRVACDPADCK